MESTQLLPRTLQRAAAWMGGHDWLSLSAGMGRRVDIKENYPSYDGKLTKAEWNALELQLGVYQYRKIDLVGFYTLTKLFAGGIKVFRPTIEQCEAMANVDVEIDFADYRQPYPVICFEYPKEFGQKMAEKLGAKQFPTFTICHHDGKSGAINVSSSFSTSKEQIAGLLLPRGEMTIEQALKRRAADDRDDREEEFTLAEMTQRIALNFCLLMANSKFIKRWEDPKQVEKHKQMARANNPEKKARAQLFQLSDKEVIEFDQTVEFFGVEQDLRARQESNPTGRQMKAHWRRGHWRNQPHGPQLSLRKNVFIKPIMVRKDIFVGEVSDTTVTYKGKTV